MTETPDVPYRAAFDPRCTERTTFSELREGDLVDYWGAVRAVEEWDGLSHGQVRIACLNEHGGIDIAVSPGVTEGVWRVPREG